jgi:diguanylate cyclase (GGDEF)-like protein
MSPTSILLVEDNDDHALAFRVMIGAVLPSPCAVLRANSLGAVAEQLRPGLPTLILLDMHLPDGRGLKLLEQVTALAPQVPIVVLTSLDDERLAIAAVKAGAQDYLVKGSFDPKALLRAMRHAMARHQLLADLEHARSREANRATHDDLTGLPNRVLFFDRLGHSIDRAARSCSRFAVVFIDLDGFKQVNDVSGHAAGDEILRLVANRLQSSVRASDTVARIGGDEFTILFEPVPDRSTVDTLVNALSVKFQEPMVVDGCPHPISMSAGVAIYPEDGREPHTLLEFADTAMYAAKHASKMRPTSRNVSLTHTSLLNWSGPSGTAQTDLAAPGRDIKEQGDGIGDPVPLC